MSPVLARELIQRQQFGESPNRIAQLPGGSPMGRLPPEILASGGSLDVLGIATLIEVGRILRESKSSVEELT
jgi:hypothetical protein